MGSCCGCVISIKTGKKTPELVDDKDFEKNAHVAPVPFDVVVPARGPGDLDRSVSFFGTSMRLNDSPGASGAGGGSSSVYNNMSFTNNFADVNKSAVNKFLKNITTIVDKGDMPTNILDESLSLGSSQRAMSLSGATAGYAMSGEDARFVREGATPAERLKRLQRVEAAMRRNLYGSWRMNFTLIQLAFMRIVPTLRVNPRALEESTAAAASASASAAAPQSPAPRPPAAAASAARRPVLVIHANSVQVEENTDSMAAPEDCASLASMSQSGFSPREAASAAPATPASPAVSLHADTSVSGASRVEHYEMLALTCRDIPVDGKVATKIVDDTWDFLSKDACTAALNGGACCFRFMCVPTNAMDAESLNVINTFINVSSFADEVKENNCPKVNIYDPDEAARYIGLMVKAMYMLPGVRLADITPQLVASMEYQRACQPGGPKLDATDRKDTFRMCLTIIKFVFSITIQFRVAEVTDPAILESFRSMDGMVPAKVIMLERTKRNIANVDATAKVRSMLLYYPVNDGVLVNSHTVVLNTSLPKVVSKLVNTFGSQGAASSADTAKLTRRYLNKRFGDCRGK